VEAKSASLRVDRPVYSRRVEHNTVAKGGIDTSRGLFESLGGRDGDAHHSAARNGTTFADVSPPTWAAHASMTGRLRSSIELRW
jgi:hypothetical protein